MPKLRVLSLFGNPLGRKFLWYYCKTFTDIDPTEEPDEVEKIPYRREIEEKLKKIMIIDEIFTPAAETLINQLIKKKANC